MPVWKGLSHVKGARNVSCKTIRGVKIQVELQMNGRDICGEWKPPFYRHCWASSCWYRTEPDKWLIRISCFIQATNLRYERLVARVGLLSSGYLETPHVLSKVQNTSEPPMPRTDRQRRQTLAQPIEQLPATPCSLIHEHNSSQSLTKQYLL